MIMRRLRIDGARLKKILKPKTIVLAVVILIALVAVGVVIYKNKSAKPSPAPVVQSCSEVVKKAKESLLNNQKQQAYDDLKKYADKCAQNSGTSTQAKIGKLSYSSAIAEAALVNGDRQQAYKYAGMAVEIHKTISQSDKKNIENLPRIESILLNILGQQEADKTRGSAQ